MTTITHFAVAPSHLAGPPPAPASPSREPPDLDAAGGRGTGKPAAAPWRDMWAGGDLVKDGWTIYSGFGAAPFGSLVEDGWRVRSVAGYGRFRHDGTRRIGGKVVATRFQTTKTFADLVVGYQQQLGRLTLKGFAGVAASSGRTLPLDAAPLDGALAYGLKLEADAWLEMSPATWASVSATWTGLDERIGGRARVGYRLLPELSIGPEAAISAAHGAESGRLGAFVRYASDSGELSVAGGLTGDRDGFDQPYGSLNWLTRF